MKAEHARGVIEIYARTPILTGWVCAAEGTLSGLAQIFDRWVESIEQKTARARALKVGGVRLVVFLAGARKLAGAWTVVSSAVQDESIPVHAPACRDSHALAFIGKPLEVAS